MTNLTKRKILHEIIFITVACLIIEALVNFTDLDRGSFAVLGIIFGEYFILLMPKE